MKNKKIKLSVITIGALVTISATTFLGCGGGDSALTTTYNKITGTLSGNGYASNGFSRFLNSIITPVYARGIDDPDTIVVMYNNGEDVKEFPINLDGSFEINTELLDANDLVVFVVNKANRKIFGHLNLGTNSGEKLDYIDKSTLQSDLALGNIDTDNNCTSSTTIHSTTAFKASELDNLEAISRSDDALILYGNMWRNQDIESYMTARFNMNSIANITGNADVNTSNVYQAFGGIMPVFHWNETKFSSASAVDFYPPSTIKCSIGNGPNQTTMDQDANATTPMSNITVYNSSAAQVDTIETRLIDRIPAGDWILKDHTTNNIIGKFEFSGVNLFDSNNKFKYIIPKTKIVTSESNVLQSVEVELLKQSSSGSMSTVTQTEFKKLSREIIFSYVYNGSNSSSNFTLDEAASTDTKLVYKTSATLQTSLIDRMIFGYIVGQAKYQFFYVK